MFTFQINLKSQTDEKVVFLLVLGFIAIIPCLLLLVVVLLLVLLGGGRGEGGAVIL